MTPMTPVLLLLDHRLCRATRIGAAGYDYPAHRVSYEADVGIRWHNKYDVQLLYVLSN